MANFPTKELLEIAVGRCHLEQDIDWSSLLTDASIVSSLRKYCQAHNTEIDFILVPYFTMCGAVVGNKSTIQCETTTPFRTNQYLLMCGNPGSGKSSGFHKSVAQPSEVIETLSGAGTVSHDLSKSALLAALQNQTKEQQRFLIIASDEMGLWLNGEARDFKEWEKKKALYNSCYSGSNILVERMCGGKPNKMKIVNPHLSIIGMTQPKPLYDWIKTVNNNDDGLLDRFLIWVVKETEKKFISKDAVELPENWLKDAMHAVTSYHMVNPNKNYVIPKNLFEKVYEMENMKTRIRTKEYGQYLDVLASGDVEGAVLLRRKAQSDPLIRFSELVFRFAVGLHVGLYGIRHCLSNLPVDNIPEIIDEYVIEFAIVAVQRCMRQAQHFKDLANKSTKTYGSKMESKSKSVAVKSSANSTSTTQCLLGKDGCKTILESTKPSCSSDTIFEFESSSSSQTPFETERLQESSQYFDLSKNKELSGHGYLGKILKLKTNPKARRCHHVLFRAPYSKVDKTLLQQIGIENEEGYQKLLTREIGGSDCPLRKVVESSPNTWTDFLNMCEQNMPNFQDVPDFEPTTD